VAGTFRFGFSLSMALGAALPAWRAASAATGPCDIYLAGGTPCIAAHSTVRALYGAYAGPLYQLKRNSDNTTKDIAPVAAGGAADGPAQDEFCKGTTCVITKLYDQSERQSRRRRHRDLLPRGQEGLRPLHQAGQQLLARRPYDGRADRRAARRRLYGYEREAFQRRMLLRLRQ
jgi:hypothetical protein